MGCQKRYSFSGFVLVSLSLTFAASSLSAGQHSVSSEVQQNITVLTKTKSCPECNLTGANLNRMTLSGANLQGADLSRATLFLTDLSGANLQNSNLREAQFGGADLGDADLRGADLTGASLAGAYLGGTHLDGEMITTTPYVEDDIADVEETVYVEDIEKVKSLPETTDMTIGSRRDFEETPPSVPAEVTPEEISVAETAPPSEDGDEALTSVTAVPEETGQRAIALESKAVPVIQEARIHEREDAPQVLVKENSKKRLSQENTTELKEEIQPPISAQAESLPEKTSKTVMAHQSDQGEVDEKVTEIQTGSAGGPIETSDESNAIGSPQVEEVTEKVESGDSPNDTQIIPLDPINTPATETQLPEEISQEANGLLELEESGPVHGPGTELLKNIEFLLDTNQCYGCNLAGADLRGENLGEADLEGADLRNALLQNVDLENANLKGTNLSGADLTDADLSEADCYRADLTDANLTNANLENTLLDDADLSRVKGYKKNLLLMEDN